MKPGHRSFKIQINKRLFSAAAGIAGIVIFALVAGPLLFRAVLPPEIQAGIARRIPIMSAWLPTSTPAPTRSYTSDYLPTTDPNRAATALALLKAAEELSTQAPSLTSTSRPTVTVTNTVTSSPTSTIAPTITMPPTPTQTVTVLMPTQSTATVSLTPSALSLTLTATASITPSLTQTPTATPTDTMTPSPSPTLVPSATATPLPPTAIPLPAALHLDHFDWVPQTWNNCGPANLTQVLTFYGIKTTQKETASWLKPNVDAANVSPWQIVSYVNQFTPLRALQRVNGNINLLKRLLVARFGIIIETGFSLPDEGWMGHYLTPIGYDDSQGIVFGLDTYLGTGKDHLGTRETYSDLDTRWQQFNRVYMVIYAPQRAEELRALLGKDFDRTANYQNGLEKARSEAQTDPANPFAWFNMGTNYVLLHQYQNAAAAYDEARNAGKGLPWRMLWYQFGPFAAYYNIGDYDSAMKLIVATFGTTVHVEEIWYWRGMVYAAQGKTQLALRDFNGTLQFNPNYQPAIDAVTAIKAGQVPKSPDIP